MLKIKHQSKGIVSHGISTCAGCALELIMRKVMEVLGENTIVVIPPGCAASFAGVGNKTALKVPGFLSNLENAAAFAAGIRAALDIKGNKETTVLVLAGDGATVDIGLQALSGIIERNDRVLYICYDNEAYMNTGIQRSGSTPLYASTTTTPAGKSKKRKDLMQIAIAHNIPYAATASIHNIKDLQRKVKKAMNTNGASLIHIQSPCPTGWGYDPSKTIQIARLAVQTGCWILCEYENGKFKVNYKPKRLKPLEEYIKMQNRFKHLSSQRIKELQKQVIEYFERKCGENACHIES